MVRQLLPTTNDVVDLGALYGAVDRPPPADRPWVLVNMVASADGGTSVAGVSGPLGGAPDRVVFQAIRAVADVILVGAGTARAENYGPPLGSARLAVVTASGNLDPASRLFTEAPADNRPLVFTVRSCPPGRRAALEAVAEVVDAGDDRVDVGEALAALDERGAGVVLAEGGPSLNGQLIAARLVDEWCLTLAPALVAGYSARPAVGHELRDGPMAMRLAHLLEEDGVLFARYSR